MNTEKFSKENAAMILIDHQVGTMGWAKSMPFDELKRNALMLANTAKIMKLPIVLTSSMEEYAQGPLLAELETILPEAFENRIKRTGIVNAMEDENFANAVHGTKRKKLIIAGVTNDVCTVYPALQAVREGYEVQVVADGGASPTKMADDIALRRMEKAGITLTTTNQVIAELVGNWATPEGNELVGIIMASLNN